MVKYQSDPLSRLFSALADPTRRAILARLAQGEATIGQLAEPLPMSLPAVSKHLGILEEAGLLIRQRQGRLRICRLEADALGEAARWIAAYKGYWNQQLDGLAGYLDRGGPAGEEKEESP